MQVFVPISALSVRSNKTGKSIRESFGIGMAKFLHFPIIAAKLLEEKFNSSYHDVYAEYRASPGSVAVGPNCDNTPFCPKLFDRVRPVIAPFTHPLLGECAVFQGRDPPVQTLPQNTELTLLFDMLWGTFSSSYFNSSSKVT